MSEQQAQGADAAIDLNNELKTRREKLAALREHVPEYVRAISHDAVDTTVQEGVHLDRVVDRPHVHLDAYGLRPSDEPP